MKIINKIFAPVLVIGAVACNNAPTETVETTDAQDVPVVVEEFTYALETEGDEIAWEGFKTYSDDTHIGVLQVQEGEFQTKGEEIVGGKFVIDMNSITNSDVENEEYRLKLEGHLKSNDFFATDSFPTATFVITSIEADTSASSTSHIIKGNLTMRDTEKNITFPADVSNNGDMISINAPEFVIDRTQWGVMFQAKGSPSAAGLAKEKLIDDNIKLKVKLSAKKA